VTISGERSVERVAHRNGYRDQTWETRAGVVGLRISKLDTRINLP